MDTLKIIWSKANSIRAAHVNGRMRSFDNRLSWEETWDRYPTPAFCHKWFKNDEVLVQIRAGLTATVVLTKFDEDGTQTIIGVTDTTTYAGEFKIYDYVLTLSSVERFYLEGKSQESLWRTEWNTVFVPTAYEIEHLRLLEWSNEDPITNSYEFDYLTTQAGLHTNFMRIEAEDLDYEPAGETDVFNNQNEIVILKSDLFRKIGLRAELIPRQIAELIVIAMKHDLFFLNEVGYKIEELPEITMMGSVTEISAMMTLANSLGLNTHDIGFNCDEDCTIMVKNVEEENASGAFTLGISEGFGVTQVIAKKISGTPILKAGATPGGDEILVEDEVVGTIPPDINDVRYTPNKSGAAWTFYGVVTGGVADIMVQSIRFTPLT